MDFEGFYFWILKIDIFQLIKNKQKKVLPNYLENMHFHSIIIACKIICSTCSNQTQSSQAKTTNECQSNWNWIYFLHPNLLLYPYFRFRVQGWSSLPRAMFSCKSKLVKFSTNDFFNNLKINRTFFENSHHLVYLWDGLVELAQFSHAMNFYRSRAFNVAD
jgi:hypothetical protein